MKYGKICRDLYTGIDDDSSSELSHINRTQCRRRIIFLRNPTAQE
jgi:hypothetical protein